MSSTIKRILSLFIGRIVPDAGEPADHGEAADAEADEAAASEPAAWREMAELSDDDGNTYELEIADTSSDAVVSIEELDECASVHATDAADATAGGSEATRNAVTPSTDSPATETGSISTANVNDQRYCTRCVVALYAGNTATVVVNEEKRAYFRDVERVQVRLGGRLCAPCYTRYRSSDWRQQQLQQQ